MEKTYSLKIGKEKMQLALPESKVLYHIEGNEYPPITDLASAIATAINNPIDSKPLAQIVTPGDKVAILASDVTRAWLKMDQFLPIILNNLNSFGIPDQDIFLVNATGTHRAHTEAENIITYGQEVVNRIKIYQHNAYDNDNLLELGVTSRGTPVFLNKLVCQADKVILTGGTVYHLMAGYGGGRKSVMPGISGDKTVQANHSIAMHPEVGKGVNPLCQAGATTGNPLHEDMVEVAQMLNPDFLINFAYNAHGEFAEVVAGNWLTAWEKCCQYVDKIFGIEINKQADLVIATAGGFPKDINLYQGSKTVDNAYFACKQGGTIIFLLECPDIYEPPAFTQWLRFEDIQEFENAVRADFSIPAFIAFKLTDTAQKYNCIAVTKPENFEVFKRVGMKTLTSLDEAYALAQESLPKDFTVTLMPQGANTLPIIK